LLLVGGISVSTGLGAVGGLIIVSGLGLGIVATAPLIATVGIGGLVGGVALGFAIDNLSKNINHPSNNPKKPSNSHEFFTPTNSSR
jgi:hypothetical protein